jgi:hypothetical protein
MREGRVHLVREISPLSRREVFKLNAEVYACVVPFAALVEEGVYVRYMT